MADFKRGRNGGSRDDRGGYAPRGERGGFGSKRTTEERRYGRSEKTYGNHNDKFGGFKSDRSGFRSERPTGGFKSDRSGFRNERPTGGFKSDRPAYRSERPTGGFKSDRGSFRSERPTGGFKSDRGSFRSERPTGGFKSDRGSFRSERPAPTFRAVRPAPAPSYAEETVSLENILAGRNPIREAIVAGRSIEKLLVAHGLTGSALEIIGRARDAGIIVQEVDRTRLDAIYPNHQGMIAYASAADYVTLDELLEIPQERGEDPFFVILDGITDPHNLGAILRSAAASGAHGVIVPERRAAGLVPAAVKAAAGALEHIAVAKVGNLNNTINILKDHGVWLMAASADGQSVYDVNMSGPICLVIGSEGDGVSSLVRSNCDFTVSLPMANGMESLNASVAAGILLYEIRKTRGAN